jgi:hypothetical protein
MLIEREQIIHIVSEAVIIAGISIYFHYQNKKQSERIDELENVVVQLQDFIGKQEESISKLSNDVSFLSMNLQNINKSIQNLSIEKQDQSSINKKDDKAQPKKIKSNKKLNNESIKIIPNHLQPQQFPLFPNLVHMTSIPQEPIIIMEMNPIQKHNKNKQEIRVEEVIDSIENLDKELEDELKELENDNIKETFEEKVDNKNKDTKVNEIKNVDKHISDNEDDSDDSDNTDSENYSSDEENSS